MRVAYLLDAAYIHEQRWLRHFVAAGVECEVISFRPAQIEGARVHHIGGAEPLGKARYMIHARRIKQLIRELEPDIVHAAHLTSYGFLGALADVHPLVVSVIGTDVLEAPRLTPFHGWLTRYALAHADVITATGLHLATETTRYAPPSTPVTVVPYGADLERFQPAEREQTERIVIGAASRLSPEKGLSYLIEAYAVLRQRFPGRVSLRIAGDGPERAKLEVLTGRLGLQGDVEFCGWLEHESLPAFLQGLDIFALPSIYEGFGVAAVEASATALPVVATNVYGIPDVVRDGVSGLLVPPKDSQALALVLGRLVEDEPLRRSLGDAGRLYVAGHYDWQQNARQMERIYEDLLGARSLGISA